MEVSFIPEPSPIEKALWRIVWLAAALGACLLVLFLRARYLDSKPARPSGLASRYRGLAEALAKKGRPAQALAAYSQSIRHADKPEASLYWARADTSMILKRYAEAAQDYERAIELAPHLPYPWMAKAMSLALDGKHKEAISFADRALELNARYEMAYFWRGFSEEKIGRLKEAEFDYSKAIELNSSSSTYYLARAVVRLKSRNFPAAREDLRRALRLNPKVEETPLMKSIRQVYGHLL